MIHDLLQKPWWDLETLELERGMSVGRLDGYLAGQKELPQLEGLGLTPEGSILLTNLQGDFLVGKAL